MDDLKSGARWPEAPDDLPGAGLPGLAHDLNSWLTPVKTCLQLWEAGETEKAAALRTNALQNLNTVLSCLAWVREGAASQPPAMEPVKLLPLLHQAVAECDALLRDKNLTVELAPTTEAEIPADVWLLRRLFLNLLNNAVHASPAGGRIVLQVSLPSSADKVAQISFRNTCLPDLAAAGEAALRRRLGLRICQEICRLHHGQMDLVCEENEPTLNVVLRFPLAQTGA